MAFFDEEQNESQLGPLHWTMGAADEIYGCYEDDAVLPLDRSIAAQPGVDLVEWYDREEFPDRRAQSVRKWPARRHRAGDARTHGCVRCAPRWG